MILAVLQTKWTFEVAATYLRIFLLERPDFIVNIDYYPDFTSSSCFIFVTCWTTIEPPVPFLPAHVFSGLVPAPSRGTGSHKQMSLWSHEGTLALRRVSARPLGRGREQTRPSAPFRLSENTGAPLIQQTPSRRLDVWSLASQIPDVSLSRRARYRSATIYCLTEINNLCFVLLETWFNLSRVCTRFPSAHV